ncbi:MAG TPA: hypothetical protein VJ438_01530 [Candidatus Nanoarchaeia archaeon]|nr:hypothetical protein [Candidatus Nanoarchaeia archaeon]
MEETKGLTEWEELKSEGSFWNPIKENEEIEGVVTNFLDTQYGLQITLKNDKTEWTTPSHRVLQNRLEGSKIGDYIKIVFIKEELPTIKGRNGTKIYKVFKKINNNQ